MNNGVLIFGGTGSLGKVLIKKMIGRGLVATFSRDEAKSVNIRKMFPHVKSFIGDIRDFDSVLDIITKLKPKIIINAAALKNVPECEDFPFEAVKTNVLGTQNLVRAVERSGLSVKCLSISTDKAAKPVNSYGMTKALQERLHLCGTGPSVFNAVRYGNVLESRGSVIPFFKERIQNNETLPITHPLMTRFFLSLDEAVDLIFTALEDNTGGKIFIPKVKSAYIKELAEILCEHYKYDFSKITESHLRPGEKIDEILISAEEWPRTIDAKSIPMNTFIIKDVKNTVFKNDIQPEEYSSGNKNVLMTKEELREFLTKHGVLT